MARWVHVGRVGGYGIITGEAGEVEEFDTFTCPHCNGVCIIRLGSGKQRGYCHLCNGPTCGRKNCMECVPFMKKLERHERRFELRKAMDRA